MDVTQVFNWLFTNPAGYAIAGGLGGFLMDSLHKGFIEFPQKIQNGSKSGWTLGFTAALIAGLFAGVLADNNMLFSFLAGAGLGGVVTAAPTVLEKRRQYRYDRNRTEKDREKKKNSPEPITDAVTVALELKKEVEKGEDIIEKEDSKKN